MVTRGRFLAALRTLSSASLNAVPTYPSWSPTILQPCSCSIASHHIIFTEHLLLPTLGCIHNLFLTVGYGSEQQTRSGPLLRQVLPRCYNIPTSFNFFFSFLSSLSSLVSRTIEQSTVRLTFPSWYSVISLWVLTSSTNPLGALGSYHHDC